MKPVVAAILLIVTVGLVVFAFGWAQGTPSAVSGSSSVTLSPTTSQTVPVTLTFQAYSIQSPNSVWQEGSKILYSAWESTSSGKVSVLAQNQTISPAVVSSNGWLYTLSATVTFSTTALCGAGTLGCNGVMNLTVQAQAQVTTPFAVLQGATSTIVLSSSQAYQMNPSSAAQTASPNTMYFQLGFPITVVAAADLIVISAVFVRHPAIFIAGAGLVVLAVVELVVL